MNTPLRVAKRIVILDGVMITMIVVMVIVFLFSKEYYHALIQFTAFIPCVLLWARDYGTYYNLKYDIYPEI